MACTGCGCKQTGGRRTRRRRVRKHKRKTQKNVSNIVVVRPELTEDAAVNLGIN